MSLYGAQRTARARSGAFAAALLLVGGCFDGGRVASRSSAPEVTPTATADGVPSALRLRTVALDDPARLVVSASGLCTPAGDQVIVDCAVTRLGAETVGWLVVDGGPAGGRIRLFRGMGPLLGEFLTADDPGNDWTSIQVGQTELTGDGVDELVLGFRDGGANEVLELAVVSLDPGIVLRKRLPHGRVVLGGDQKFTAFVASSPDGPFSRYRITIDLRDEAGGVEPARFVSDFLGTLSAKDVPSSEL